MKIWGEIPRIPGIYGKKNNVGKIDKAVGVDSKKDVVSISEHAKDYQTVLKALKNIPDIRKDKVDELAAKFEAGTYNIQGREIADKIIKSVIDRKV